MDITELRDAYQKVNSVNLNELINDFVDSINKVVTGLKSSDLRQALFMGVASVRIEKNFKKQRTAVTLITPNEPEERLLENSIEFGSDSTNVNSLWLATLRTYTAATLIYSIDVEVKLDVENINVKFRFTNQELTKAAINGMAKILEKGDLLTDVKADEKALLVSCTIKK